MEPADLALRNRTYHRFVELGRAPSAADIATSLGESIEAVRDGWRRLHDAHALVLDRDQLELRMLNPFSVVPTPHRVRAARRTWFANCAWDAFGIGAALHVDSQIETTCPDCQEPIHVSVTDSRPNPEGPVFHVLVPAANWWADIGYT